MAFTDFRDFPVWKKAVENLCVVYMFSSDFPKEEKYGLTSDIRRAANSVAHNIAEGFGRYERKDKTRFYKIARGSAFEIISQVMVSSKLGLLKENQNSIIDKYKNIIAELDKLIKTIETR